MKIVLLIGAMFAVLFIAAIILTFYFIAKMRNYDDTIEREHEAIQRAYEENEKILGI